MRIDLNTKHGFGLGDYLCMISAWMDVSEPIEVFCDNKEHQYDRLSQLVKVLRIPDNKLKITYNENHKGDFSGAWHLKIFSNYYRPEQVLVDGEKIDTTDKNRKRMVIGIAGYSGLDFYLDNDYNIIRGSNINEGNKRSHMVPQVKFQALDFYGEVFKFARRCGYDVVTLDHPSNLEHKVKTLVEQCDAVIAYEGGIAHLCHVLRVPCFVFNYRNTEADAIYGQFQVPYIHQSKTMYFLKNPLELLSWDKDKFMNLVSGLRHETCTNNTLVTGEHRIVPTKGATSKLDFIDKDNNLAFRSLMGPQLSDSAKAFIEHFYKHKFPYLNT